MCKTDPIADMLTIVRNAVNIRKQQVKLPRSKVCENIVKRMQSEGFVRSYSIDGETGDIIVELKYFYNGKPAITSLKRVSKPGRRVYTGAQKLKRILSGYGVAIVSTSQGIMLDAECRRHGIGGEVLCYIW